MRAILLSYATAVITLSACDEHPIDDPVGGSCYSPTQNLDDAYEPGAEGCACKDEQAVCIEHEGAYLAFFCDEADRHWHAGFDGPCEDLYREKHCYSPTQNLASAYETGARGCACSEGDADQCVEGVALLCDGSRWNAVEDGPCAPQAPAPAHRHLRLP